MHKGPVSKEDVSSARRLGPRPLAIMPKMSSTLVLFMTTVVTPAAVASSAAIILVDMPPVPKDVPSVAVETGVSYHPTDGRLPSLRTSEMSFTTRTAFALGLTRGLSVYMQSTSVRRKR